MKWKIVDLNSRHYDAIVGQNLLVPCKAIINLADSYIHINHIKTLFENNNNYPYILKDICTLEGSEDDFLTQLKLDHLNNDEKNNIIKFLKNNEDLFYKEGDILSSTREICHEIVTTIDKPLYSKIYRYPQIHEKEIERQINEMLSQNIIVESKSPYNSPLWIVPKKLDHSNIKKWRIVIDYRKLNEVTVDDKFPIPNMEAILDKLGRAQYFSTLDLAKGFHQIPMRECDQHKTAFSTPHGHYEFLRMPFGLKNAPSTFQRLMNTVLRDCINKICVVYLDDILIFSTSLEEHLLNLGKIFNKLRSAGLKIQTNKCNFLNKETEFLGHILTSEGIKPNPNKISVIQNLKIPTTQKQIKSFLGITGFYRKFVKDYAKIAGPILKYLKKNTTINLNDPSYISAFEKLKEIITTHPILRYPNFNKKFKLLTDASNLAIGAVLSQEGHPVCYASRTLNDHEKNYSTIEKELLALVWGTKYYRPYLFGTEFDLQTDHQPIKWLHAKYTGKDINPRLQRWLIQLGEYNFKLEYIKGKDNKIADFLSRINSEENEINLIEKNSENSNIESRFLTNVQSTNPENQNLLQNIISLDTVLNRFKLQIILVQKRNIAYEEVFGNKRFYVEIRDIENGADIIRRNIQKGKIGIYSELEENEYSDLLTKLLTLYSDTESVKFYRCKYFAKDVVNIEQLRKQIALFHKNESGHSGILATYESLKHKIYNPKLKININEILNNCDICTGAKYDRNPIKKKFEITETPKNINEIIHIDIYTNSKHNFINAIDKFSKHAISLYLEDRSHITILEKIRQLISIKRKMQKLTFDNEFGSHYIKEFREQENIQFHITKPNSHTGNADVEHFNGTLTEKVRLLNLENKLPIRTQILKAVEIYNNSFHSAIKTTPLAVEHREVDFTTIYENLIKAKENVIHKRNINREDYVETRNVGFIKNNKSLRHKEEPKFRKYNLQNVHESNIKRPIKILNANRQSLLNT